MKYLEIAWLQDFAPNTHGFLGALNGPQTPCRIERIPLWKFLPTGLTRTNENKAIGQQFDSR